MQHIEQFAEASEQCSLLAYVRFLTTIQKRTNGAHDRNLQEASCTAEPWRCYRAALTTPALSPAALPSS